ncbi:hypothetical protein Cgig2_027076 [Carnegiea gigantea]|uniref:Exostosin GT47 domain-containing protein n=1 Tax=Carnegiea gigantea TaxID=171969 RepID=A0A9Q1KA46_9CARY|nr:hypothetical protein Cgig2_027076 [Carnegiea gigantea]
MSVCGKHKYSKSVLGLVFCALLTVTYLFLIGTVDVRSHIVPFFQFEAVDPNPSWVVPTCRSLTPLRVYMYDLPRRFNVGMLNRRSSDKTPVTAATLPPWPTSSGLRKQHSVEYWMMASLLYDGGGEERETEMEAVRVSDPDVADVFFVPFFSSLSFNTYGHNMTDPETERDKKLQADTLKFLRGSKYWQRSGGRDHVIPMHHPNAFRFFRDQVNASILIVADFGRYPKSLSNLRKDVVAPYVHVVDSYTEDESSDPFESRPTLLFFRGTTVRKDVVNDNLMFQEGVIRAKLANVLAEYNDVHYETSFASEENIKLSTQGMRSSKFCLHPAGDTPSSCRLFDAIVSHCVPVIVSDQIELPFEDELDYSQFAIFFSTKEALKPGYMVKQLRKIPKERWISMWKRLKNISHQFEFQHPPKSGDAVNMIWRQVRHKLPAAKLADHRTRRLKIPDWWGDRR